jgi:hypothetical protein
MKCHHCGKGTNLGNLIKHVDDGTYKQYILERYTNNASRHNDHADPKLVFESIPRRVAREDATAAGDTEPLHELLEDDILSRVQCVGSLPDNHPVRHYIKDRQILEDQVSLFYYAPKFKRFVNSCVEKFTPESLEYDYPRLIIPYFNEHGKVTMFNCRAFGKEEPKYMMVRLDEDAPKVFGLDRVDRNKTVYVTEGEIDSLMIENGIATGGAASLDSPQIQAMKGRVVLVHDNEPRNREVGAVIKKTIQEGYNMFIPPDDFGYKDLNEAVQDGMSREALKKVVDENCYQGLAAELRFANWIKV